MALAGKEQAFGKAARKIGFEGGDPRAVQPFMALRAPGKSLQIRLVPPGRHDERALALQTDIPIGPPFDPREPGLDDRDLGTFGLAERGEHAARQP